MIRFVVALHAEARPVIRRFGLERVGRGRSGGTGLPVWRAGEASLVVSGVGSAAAAAATAHLGGCGADGSEAAWLNLGVGGHRDRPVGEVVLAHKVVEAATGRSWYPPLVYEPPCATATVRTVHRPEREYGRDAVYEMEAAGFCAAAARFASAELVQVVKVVSDNLESPPGRLTAARVEELVEGRIETVVRIARLTAELARELRERREPPPAIEGFGARWRFTVTQRRRLERLLRRLRVLESAAPAAAELEELTSAGAILEALEARLAAHRPGLG